MDISYTPKDAVIDSIAVILILFPEPATTALGIAMMARPRGKKKQASASVKLLHNYPDYIYRVDNIRGREITWEARVIMPGQLPLQRPNRANIKIKGREEYVFSRSTNDKLNNLKAPLKLPPGVKVHHTLIKPIHAIQNRPKFGSEQIMHHELRQAPQPPTGKRSGVVDDVIHHTIENSPGYIRAQAGEKRRFTPQIINHSLKDSPAAYMNNPIKIEKPTIIVKHHALNPSPSIKEPLISPPLPRRRRSNNKI